MAVLSEKSPFRRPILLVVAMAGALVVAAGFSVGAPARLVVDARRRWKGTLLNTKRRPKKVREATDAGAVPRGGDWQARGQRRGACRVPACGPC